MCDQVLMTKTQSHWPWGVLVGGIWEANGVLVKQAGAYLPTSFCWAPCNPQEKISSGYKAWEFLLYIYGMGLGVFYRILPELYYSHFCMLVQAIQIIFQHAISHEQVATAHWLLLRWVLGFEELYCK